MKHILTAALLSTLLPLTDAALEQPCALDGQIKAKIAAEYREPVAMVDVRSRPGSRHRGDCLWMKGKECDGRRACRRQDHAGGRRGDDLRADPAGLGRRRDAGLC